MSETDLIRLRQLLGEVRLNLLAALDKISASVAGWRDVDEADRLLYAAMIRLERGLAR